MKNFLLALSLLAFALCSAQTPDVTQSINKLIEDCMQKNKIPGMAVTITQNNRTLLSQGYGYANVAAKTPVIAAQTKFRLASITKSFTAVVLGKLQELDSINLEGSVYDYLPALPKKPYNITIAQLAGHLSGMQRVASGELYTCNNTYSQKDFYKSFAEDKLLFEPGTKLLYSNYGYKLLGLVIEAKAGMDITAAHQKYVFDVIGMTNTQPEKGEAAATTATFYVHEKGMLTEAPCLSCTFKYAQGCYLSTSEDLAKFGNAVLYSGKLLKNETLTQLIKSQKYPNKIKTGYGYGFSSGAYPAMWYGHNGGYTGSRSIYKVYSENQLVIAILINTDDEFLDKLATDIAKIVVKQ